MDSLEFSILRPWWLLLLLLPLIFIYVDFARHYKLQNFIREDFINYLKPKKKKKNHDVIEEEEIVITEQVSSEEQKTLIAKPKLWKKYGWLIFPYFCAVFALSGPAVTQERSLFQSDENWVWVLDSSLSMLADDLPPSRFQRVRYSLIELLNASKQHRRISLIAYAGDNYLISPPTDDMSTMLFNLQELDPSIMPVRGSEPLPALLRAQEILDNDKDIPGNILLILDDVKNEVEADDLIKFIKATPYPVYIYAIGTTGGSPIKFNNQLVRDATGNVVMATSHLDLIQKVAKDSGSKVYFEASDNAPHLVQMYNYEHPKYKKTDKSKYLRKDIGYWFLIGAIVASLGFFRNYFFALVFAVMLGSFSFMPSNNAMAAEDTQQIEDVKYPNEYGYQLYQEGKYDESLKYFTDHRWRGNAFYKLNRFDKALQEYQTLGNDADAKYNIGNCFVHLQTPNALKDALVAYDQALELDPNHADASQNKTIILNYLHQLEAVPQRTVTVFDEETGSEIKVSESDILATPEEADSLMRRRLLLQQKKKKSVSAPEQIW